MKKELISIIIPVYNVEKYLTKCIDSIINQTYKEIEIILVDDGSTDSSGKICNQYKNKDKRIIVIHKKNGGLSSARNSGLDIMKGKYVSFIDSDDFVQKNMIEIMYSNILKYECDIVCCKGKDYVDFSYDGESEIEKHSSDNNQIYTKEEALLKCDTTVMIVAYQKLYKSDIFKKLRFKEGLIHEDAQIAPYIYELINKAVLIPNVLYYRYIREDSIVHLNFSEKNYDVIKVAEDRLNLYLTKKYEYLYNQAYTFLLGAYVILYKKAYNSNADKKIKKNIILDYKKEYKKYKRKLKFIQTIKYGFFNLFPNICVILLNLLDKEN